MKAREDGDKQRGFSPPVPLLKIHDDGAFQGTIPLQFRKVNGSHDFFGSDLPWERGSEVTQPSMPTGAGGGSVNQQDAL